MSDWNLNLNDWMGMLFLALVCTFVAHTLWPRVTTVLSTVATIVISYLIVPVSLLLSYVLLHEPMGFLKLSGATTIIIVNQSGLRTQWEQNAFMAKA